MGIKICHNVLDGFERGKIIRFTFSDTAILTRTFSFRKVENPVNHNSAKDLTGLINYSERLPL